MRIAFVSVMRGAAWGGSEELWAAAARAAVADGHEVAVSVFDWPQRAAAVRELEAEGARVLVRPLRSPRWTGWIAAPGWLRELEAWGPDVVCLSQGAPYECVGRRATRPLLRWLKRSRAGLVNVVQYVGEESKLRRRTRPMAEALFERASVNAFVARRNFEAVERQMGGKVPRAVVVQNPVNLRDLSELPWPESAAARFACVGRLHVDAKGQDLLLRALAGEEWRQRAWRLDLFGEGRDEATLRRLAAELGIGDRVHFRGHQRDVRAIWAECQVLVLPSRNEGTALAMVEAMLLGRPVVATDVGGAAEWAREGQSGWLAAGPTVKAVGEALERAWSARERWAELGRAAREITISKRHPDPGRALLAIILDAAAGRPDANPGGIHPA